MAEKNENEVTVKVLCSRDELIDTLEKKGFEREETFSLDDYYYIPADLDIASMSTRDILSKAVILRYIVEEDTIVQKITFKIKHFAPNGDIVSQKSINCVVENIEDAKRLFEALNYREIMNIKEDDIVYHKGDFEMAIKFVENSDILIEIESEPNTDFDTIDKIKAMIDKTNLPIERGEYFIKKAENELNKKLNRKRDSQEPEM